MLWLHKWYVVILIYQHQDVFLFPIFSRIISFFLCCIGIFGYFSNPQLTWSFADYVLFLSVLFLLTCVKPYPIWSYHFYLESSNYDNDSIHFVTLENLVEEHIKNILLSRNTRWRKKYHRYHKCKGVLSFFHFVFVQTVFTWISFSHFNKFLFSFIIIFFLKMSRY